MTGNSEVAPGGWLIQLLKNISNNVSSFYLSALPNCRHYIQAQWPMEED